MVRNIDNGNQDLVTIIRCICADGTALHPSVVFQGQRWCDVDCISVDCTYVCRHVRSDSSSGENQGSGVQQKIGVIDFWWVVVIPKQV
jgi:hypothetical protein